MASPIITGNGRYYSKDGVLINPAFTAIGVDSDPYLGNDYHELAALTEIPYGNTNYTQTNGDIIDRIGAAGGGGIMMMKHISWCTGFSGTTPLYPANQQTRINDWLARCNTAGIYVIIELFFYHAFLASWSWGEMGFSTANGGPYPSGEEFVGNPADVYQIANMEAMLTMFNNSENRDRIIGVMPMWEAQTMYAHAGTPTSVGTWWYNTLDALKSIITTNLYEFLIIGYFGTEPEDTGSNDSIDCVPCEEYVGAVGYAYNTPVGIFDCTGSGSPSRIGLGYQYALGNKPVACLEGHHYHCFRRVDFGDADAHGYDTERDPVEGSAPRVCQWWCQDWDERWFCARGYTLCNDYTDCTPPNWITWNPDCEGATILDSRMANCLCRSYIFSQVFDGAGLSCRWGAMQGTAGADVGPLWDNACRAMQWALDNIIMSGSVTVRPYRMRGDNGAPISLAYSGAGEIRATGMKYIWPGGVYHYGIYVVRDLVSPGTNWQDLNVTVKVSNLSPSSTYTFSVYDPETETVIYADAEKQTNTFGEISLPCPFPGGDIVIHLEKGSSDEDLVPPQIMSLSPPNGANGVSPETLISFILIDSGSGVNSSQTTLTITNESGTELAVAEYGDFQAITPVTMGFRYTYNYKAAAGDDLPDGEISCRVYCADNDENETDHDWSFNVDSDGSGYAPGINSFHVKDAQIDAQTNKGRITLAWNPPDPTTFDAYCLFHRKDNPPNTWLPPAGGDLPEVGDEIGESTVVWVSQVQNTDEVTFNDVEDINDKHYWGIQAGLVYGENPNDVGATNKCWGPGNRLTMISLIFDDVTPVPHSTLALSAAANGLRISFALNGGSLAPADITAYQTMISAGATDITNHGKTHLDLTDPGTDVDDEVNGGKTALEEAFTLTRPINCFAYPFGSYDDDVIEVVQENHIGARTVLIGYNLMLPDEADMWELVTQYVGASTTTEDINGWVDAAISNHRWLIVYGHGCGGVGYDSPADCAEITDAFTYMGTKLDDASVNSLEYHITYRRLYENTFFEVTQIAQDGIEISLTCDLDPDDYVGELTLRTIIPMTATTAIVKQGNEVISNTVQITGGENNTVYSINPFGDDITVFWE